MTSLSRASRGYWGALCVIPSVQAPGRILKVEPTIRAARVSDTKRSKAECIISTTVSIFMAAVLAPPDVVLTQPENNEKGRVTGSVHLHNGPCSAELRFWRHKQR